MVRKIQIKETGFTWVYINNPEEQSIEYLKKKYKFHHLDLEDCLSENQRPKIDDYENYLFIVLQVPVRTGRKKQINSSELNIFIGQNFVVTLHEENPILMRIFEECRKSKKTRDNYMGKGSGYFLYMITNELFESCFPLLDDESRQVNEMEKDVFDENYNKDRLKEILMVKKDIINFRRIIMPERAIIAQLEHKNKKFLPENLDVYFDDIVDKIEKMWNNLENLQELVISLQETNESIISHNTNNVIKILTVLSVVILPLTFITGFYGMNVRNLPFAETPHATLVVSVIITAVAIAMIVYFKFKKWI